MRVLVCVSIFLLLYSTEILSEPECRGDFNHDGRVTVDEIIVSLQNSLNGCPQSPQLPETAHILIAPGATGRGAAGYGSNPLVIAAGTTVTWTNMDKIPHTVTSDISPPLWDSGSIAPGESYSVTFNQVGAYSYSSSMSSDLGMSGTIIVRAELPPNIPTTPTAQLEALRGNWNFETSFSSTGFSANYQLDEIVDEKGRPTLIGIDLSTGAKVSVNLVEDPAIPFTFTLVAPGFHICDGYFFNIVRDGFISGFDVLSPKSPNGKCEGLLTGSRHPTTGSQFMVSKAKDRISSPLRNNEAKLIRHELLRLLRILEKLRQREPAFL